MKIFKLMAIALVAMIGLNSCSKDCDHDFIEVDYSKELVGTWTCLEAGYAEALVINADGSVLSTGVEDGEYWENIKGNIKTVNNKMTMIFEDNDNFEGRFEMLSGEAFTIFEENGESFTYRYCEEDLSDEVVGMWVSNDGPTDMENEIQIRIYDKEGKISTTGVRTVGGNSDWILNEELEYKVVGDLVFMKLSESMANQLGFTHNVEQLIYTPNATALGDIMSFIFNLPVGDGFMESRSSWLRIKQHLDLPGQKYDYIKTFITNVKGLDKDIEFMGYTFNFAKMDGVMMDKALKAILFNVEFPDANTIKYSCHYNGQNMSMEAPIVVEGNKMTVKMSTKNAVYKDVDLYTFQDQDNTQMHMYMHSTAFVNFFGNMQVTIMEQLGMLDTTDAAAVKAVFDSIDEAVETINVSFVMTKAAK